MGDFRGKNSCQNTQNLIIFISWQRSRKFSGFAHIIFKVRKFQRICESLGMVPDFLQFFAYLSQGLEHRYFSYLHHTKINCGLHSNTDVVKKLKVLKTARNAFLGLRLDLWEHFLGRFIRSDFRGPSEGPK